MHALAIVTLTLIGLAGVLFGSDVLDRRLTIRSGGSVGPPDPAPPVDGTLAVEPAPDGAFRHTSLIRPVAPCSHRRGRATTPSPAARHTAGPLRVHASH